jgi:Holliday junction resolvase RusA-like endonuclease
MKKKFIVMGEPSKLVRARLSKSRQWDSFAEAQHRWHSVFEDQHGGERLFAGPLKMEIKFVLGFQDSISVYKRTEKEGDFFSNRPSMSLLIRSIEDVCLESLYLEEGMIVITEAFKVYGMEPRTEITITEVKIDEKKQQ